ncbi:MAG: hypothetical protein JW860_03995 [Sedimentisphaerales bacterium]|nr:hypothetical protein [Sedimentisphaerales bacterium]
MADEPELTIEQIVQDDGRYPLKAVDFVRDGLRYTVEKSQPRARSRRTDPAARHQPHHVSGQQLCQGLRDLALERWGLMARRVLAHWKITSTRDFGEIVFMLVNNGWMQKQPHDSIEDFDDVYDFHEAFDRNFDISPD